MTSQTTFVVFEPPADVKGAISRLRSLPEVSEAYAVFGPPYGDGTIIARVERDGLVAVLEASGSPHPYPATEHLRSYLNKTFSRTTKRSQESYWDYAYP